MDTNKLLEEIYSHFESDDKNETLCNLIVDCIETGIDYWNEEWPAVKLITEFYGENVWEAVKSGETLKFGSYDETGELSLETILRGLNRMKSTEPESYEEIIGENWDAYTCDEFFQFCIFGEVIFG